MGRDEMRRTKIGDSYFIRIGLNASMKSQSEEVDSWLRPILCDCQRNMHYDIAISLKAVVARGVRILITNGSYAAWLSLMTRRLAKEKETLMSASCYMRPHFAPRLHEEKADEEVPTKAKSEAQRG